MGGYSRFVERKRVLECMGRVQNDEYKMRKLIIKQNVKLILIIIIISPQKW